MASINLENVTKIFTPSQIATKLSGRRALLAPRNATLLTTRTKDSKENIRALDNVHFFVPDGQTTVIVGPSGCGKSTLLRAIAGLIDYQGDIYYDDRNVNSIPVKERRIGMVFQNYALYPHFYGLGNLSFYFKVNKAPDAETEKRIRITSEIMGIGFSELLKRKPGTLSGGQQQRLAIGRAIVRKPELFLFDEPLSNLDAKLRTRTRVEIKRLLHRFNITAVYVTHDQTEALALADEIAVMRDGKMEQVGTYQQIIRNPANEFVAGFLGLPPMNLIPGYIEDGHLCIADLQVDIPDNLHSSIQTNQEITIGIHPDDIKVNHMPEGENKDSFILLLGTVEVIEPDFGRQRIIIHLTYNNITYSAVAPIDAQIHTGYSVETYLPVSSLFIFNKKSGTRIG
jgi:ABC-type sugar transport system ATPase subunit